MQACASAIPKSGTKDLNLWFPRLESLFSHNEPKLFHEFEPYRSSGRWFPENFQNTSGKQERLKSMGTTESILLQSGISIDVVGGGKFRVVYFSKPVRGIELSQEESASLVNILTKKEELPRPTEILRVLMKEGFFRDPKDLRTIRSKLESRGLFVKASLLNTLMGKLVSRKEITRTGERRSYRYFTPQKKANPK